MSWTSPPTLLFQKKVLQVDIKESPVELPCCAGSQLLVYVGRRTLAHVVLRQHSKEIH